MEVVEASSGGNGFQVFDSVLADGADFLGRGLPQLEHGGMGEPLNLAPFRRTDLGPGEKELEDLRVGRPGTTAGWGWRRERKSRPGRVPDRETGGKDHSSSSSSSSSNSNSSDTNITDNNNNNRNNSNRNNTNNTNLIFVVVQ